MNATIGLSFIVLLKFKLKLENVTFKVKSCGSVLAFMKYCYLVKNDTKLFACQRDKAILSQ